MTNIGFGTAAIGRPQYINIKQENTEPFEKAKFIQAGIQVLDAAYAQGIRYYDTAPGYGLAEQLLIDWAKHKQDPAIEIATKWGYEYVADFEPTATVHEVKDHSLKQLIKQWKQSKQLFPNLTTLQIHSATFDTGVLEDQEVLQHLAQLKTTHNIKIGLTTTGAYQVDVIKSALEISGNGIPLFDTFQITYNILDQSLMDIVNQLHSLGKRIIIKEALANGRVFRNVKYAQYNEMYKTLEQLAYKYKVGVDAVALRFCIDTSKPFIVLSGASTSFQVRENLKANDFQLTAQELLQLATYKIDPETYWSERKALDWN